MDFQAAILYVMRTAYKNKKQASLLNSPAPGGYYAGISQRKN